MIVDKSQPTTSFIFFLYYCFYILKKDCIFFVILAERNAAVQRLWCAVGLVIEHCRPSGRSYQRRWGSKAA